MGNVLFTGFPGFIGARLLPRLLDLSPETTFHCLVQERFVAAARDSLREIQRTHPEAEKRITVVVGDITLAGLGIDEPARRELLETLTGAYHLAAVYDLAVKREIGYRINVEGTRRVLEFLAEAKRFERLHYVSTAYVAGGSTGVFRETDLDRGQSFKNHYEETKFLAEVEVVKSGLPTTTYRPSIVVGDSRTGETGKFDGPYFTLSAMKRVPSGLFLRVGSGRNTANLVPVDFVLEGLARLSTIEGSRGKTYHLTDPQPVTAFEIARLFAAALGKRFLYVPVPTSVAKLMLAPKFVQRFLGMPAQTLDYFDYPCHFDASQATADLEPLGVRCPRFPDYVGRLVDFYLERQGSVRREAMI